MIILLTVWKDLRQNLGQCVVGGVCLVFGLRCHREEGVNEQDREGD